MDRCWTTFVSPLGLGLMMESSGSRQKKRNLAAHLSGGVPGAGETMKKIEFACNVETWVMTNTKKLRF